MFKKLNGHIEKRKTIDLLNSDNFNSLCQKTDLN